MKVVWSDRAKKDLWKVIDFLYEKWTVKEVDQFENFLKKLIQNIKNNISFCPPSKILDLRKCRIDKNNSLIYLNKNENIYIITLINNRSSHHY